MKKVYEKKLVLPSKRQKVWSWPAVALFSCGGMGAGLYLSSFLLTLSRGGIKEFTAGPISHGSIACITVLLGFFLILGETGRPLRGYYAIFNIKQSWISREIISLLIFILTVFIDHFAPSVVIRLISIGFAFIFILCQGFVVYSSRAITTWNIKYIPLFFLSSGLSSGCGLLILMHQVNGTLQLRDSALIGSILVALNLVILLIYLYGISDSAFRDATKNLRKPYFTLINLLLGGLLPLALLLTLYYSLGKIGIAGTTDSIVIAAGITMIFGGAIQKASIIIVSGFAERIFLSFE